MMYPGFNTRRFEARAVSHSYTADVDSIRTVTRLKGPRSYFRAMFAILQSPPTYFDDLVLTSSLLFHIALLISKPVIASIVAKLTNSLVRCLTRVVGCYSVDQGTP